MKTIEVAAIEAAKISVNKLFDKNGLFSSAYKRGFLDGIEFVQRWIPIEDELPELNLPVFVICKYSDGSTDYATVKRIGSKDSQSNWQWSSISHDTFFALKITHWRPIERI